MAIYIYCATCKTSFGLESKECKKCGTTFDRHKRYRVSVRMQGKGITKVCDNLTIARDIEADMIRDVYNVEKTKQSTLDTIWSKYLPWAKENKKTWKDDEYYYHKHLRPRFGEKRLDIISPFDIEKMKLEMGKSLNKRQKPFAKATIKHQIVLLRRLYNVATKWGLYTGENPVSKVAMPKIDNQITEYLTDEELGWLLDTLDTWPFRDTVCFIKFALYTGIWRGELFKLQWNDIDFERKTITLRAPKGGKTETIPISDEALETLKELDRTSEYVFPGKNGAQRKYFNGWERVRSAAGLPSNFRFHGLRHNFASCLVSNGIDLAVVRELLTHKDMKTTSRYAHLAPGRLKEAALKSGKLLNSKNQPQSQDKSKGFLILNRNNMTQSI